MVAGKLERLLHDLGALALEHIWKARVVLEMAMVEFRDQLPLMAIPVMDQRRDDPARLDPGIEPDAVVELESGGMIGSRPRHLLKEIVGAERLHHDHPDVFLRQRQRQAEPDRPGTDDDHPLALALHGLQRYWTSC